MFHSLVLLEFVLVNDVFIVADDGLDL